MTEAAYPATLEADGAVWLDIREAARTLGCSVRSARRNLREYRVRRVRLPANNAEKVYIDPDSLPVYRVPLARVDALRTLPQAAPHPELAEAARELVESPSLVIAATVDRATGAVLGFTVCEGG